MRPISEQCINVGLMSLFFVLLPLELPISAAIMGAIVLADYAFSPERMFKSEQDGQQPAQE